MTFDLSTSTVVQGLIVMGLGGTAKVLFNTVVELGKLGERVDGIKERVDKLEDA